MVTITNLTFVGYGKSSRLNAVLKIFQGQLDITACAFLHSKGRVIEADCTNLMISKSTFKNSNAGVLEGNSTIITDTGSIKFYELNFTKQIFCSVFLFSSEIEFKIVQV